MIEEDKFDFQVNLGKIKVLNLIRDEGEITRAEIIKKTKRICNDQMVFTHFGHWSSALPVDFTKHLVNGRIVFPGAGKFQQPAKPFNVVMRLQQLVVHGRVGDGGQVKNGIEGGVLELSEPIQTRNIRRHIIAPEASQILEMAGAKIINHSNKRYIFCRLSVCKCRE